MNDEEERVEAIRMFQDIAYIYAPFGSFFERWIPGVCKHELVRCTHGDEINNTNGRRRRCLICGRSLKGDIPPICFFTGAPH